MKISKARLSSTLVGLLVMSASALAAAEPERLAYAEGTVVKVVSPVEGEQGQRCFFQIVKVDADSVKIQMSNETLGLAEYLPVGSLPLQIGKHEIKQDVSYEYDGTTVQFMIKEHDGMFVRDFETMKFEANADMSEVKSGTVASYVASPLRKKLVKMLECKF